MTEMGRTQSKSNLIASPRKQTRLERKEGTASHRGSIPVLSAKVTNMKIIKFVRMIVAGSVNLAGILAVTEELLPLRGA